MNTCPRFVLMLTNLSFFFLLITATNAQDKNQPDDLITKPLLITINPAALVPQLNSTSSPHPKPAPNPKPEGPESNSTSPHLKPAPKSNSTPSPSPIPAPKPDPTSPHSKPETKPDPTSPHPKPAPTPKPAPKPDPTSPHSKPETKPDPTSPHPKPAPTPKPAPKPDPTSPHSKPETKPDPTSPQPKPAPNPKPAPKPDPTSPHPKPTPKPDPTSPNPKPAPKPDPTSPHPKPAPKPDPKKTVPPKPDTTTKSTASSSSPYHFANHFCLSRRLDVKSTFCLQVLRSSPASTKANDNQALLNIAAEMSIKYGEKTLTFLKKMSADKTTKPDLKPAIEDCVSAYEGYLTQYKMLMEEVGSDGQVASYDSELAKIEINSCVRALSKNKNADIVARNKVALDYARLTQNIADSLE
ncbi:hypothetical protein MIMGU_mgv1a027147mg [Erythranthe guttata]|uniref:Pectinesterase inhibitor domain-containing protein n=1 Tax=Erythranthe guttata TaxID=4155 RepID=A0A022R977_ERYGU|nr:hypothetical protein MIMGU_mgv1a027147mg [Erythranthe guttata]